MANNMDTGNQDKGKLRMDILWIIVIFVVWFLLVRFVFPRIGVST